MGNKTFSFVEPLKDFRMECWALHLVFVISLCIWAMNESQAALQASASIVFLEGDRAGFCSWAQVRVHHLCRSSKS